MSGSKAPRKAPQSAAKTQKLDPISFSPKKSRNPAFYSCRFCMLCRGEFLVGLAGRQHAVQQCFHGIGRTEWDPVTVWCACARAGPEPDRPRQCRPGAPRLRLSARRIRSYHGPFISFSENDDCKSQVVQGMSACRACSPREAH
jgi:hypothetical protein